MSTDNKRCKLCKRVLSINNFRKRATYHYHHCLECEKIVAKVNSYRKRDKAKGYISKESVSKEWTALYLQDKVCIYCGSKNDIGLDAMDPNLPHIPSNIVPCCIHCNMVKGNRFTYNEMFVLGPVIKSIIDARA